MANAADGQGIDTGEEKRVERLLHRFILAAQAHHAAMESFDEERASAQARMIAGLHQSLVREGRYAEVKLLELVDNGDPAVAGMAAVCSLRLDSSRCLAVLRRVAKEPGLLGFRAEMAVARWESGEWPE